MNSRRNIVIVVLIGMTCLPLWSFAASSENRASLTADFSRDYLRTTTLRESLDVSTFAGLATEIQDKWSPKDKQMYGVLMVHTLRSWKSACKRADVLPPIDMIRQYAAEVLSTYDPKASNNISIETELDLVSILHEEYTVSFRQACVT